jgi:hypothetical protein
MVFTPRFSARFEGPVIDNILTIIERDMKGALDYFYLADDLPDFAERAIAEQTSMVYPLLVITPVSNQVDWQEDRLFEPMRFDIFMGVIDSNANLVTRKIMKYVRALDAVLRSAAKSDYFAGFIESTPFGMVIELTHEYGVQGRSETGQYFRPALLGLTVNINER